MVLGMPACATKRKATHSRWKRGFALAASLSFLLAGSSWGQVNVTKAISGSSLELKVKNTGKDPVEILVEVRAPDGSVQSLSRTVVPPESGSGTITGPTLPSNTRGYGVEVSVVSEKSRRFIGADATGIR